MKFHWPNEMGSFRISRKCRVFRIWYTPEATCFASGLDVLTLNLYSHSSFTCKLYYIWCHMFFRMKINLIESSRKWTDTSNSCVPLFLLSEYILSLTLLQSSGHPCRWSRAHLCSNCGAARLLGDHSQHQLRAGLHVHANLHLRNNVADS
ncbi:hypothetical protein BC830DRAFT_1096262 [Chytriomyces sp. MP71]|nr:hypothetical protein BC830DRAFT_1096262 [Chytriomyces sp. MP71]